MEDDMLSTIDIAKLLHCSPLTVRRLVDALAEDGKATVVRLTPTSPRRISRMDMERYAVERGIPIDWSLIGR